LLNETTTFSIDVKSRRIAVKNHNPLKFLRADKSVRDIDFILCTYQPEKIADLKRFLNKLKWQVRLKLGYTAPISFESAAPYGTRPSGLMRYVTTLQVKNEVPYLVFDRITHQIPPRSLEAWTVRLEDGTEYTTRNPIADYYAYQFRSPAGVKPKDIEKLIRLKVLVDAMVAEGKKNGIDYFSDEYYASWKEFIDTLESSAILSIRSKRFLTQLYWNTVGTTFAHGKGIGKPIFAIFNFFTRHTQ